MSDDAPDIHALSGAYALDALDPQERASFERHLSSCTACREEVASFAGALQAMTAGLEREPTDELRSAVLESISEIRPRPPVVGDAAGTVVELAPRRRWAFLALAVAAVVLGVALAGAGWRSVTLQQQVTELSADAATVSAVLGAPDVVAASAQVSTGGWATVLVSRSTGRAALVTDGMQALPDGLAYQAWFIDSDGQAASAGMLAELAATTLTGDPRDAVAVGVTVEPAGGSAQPTTSPVVAVALPTKA